MVHAEVDPCAGGVQVADLLVGLGVRDRRVEVHQHQLREPQSERPRQLADDHLGDQRLAALRGAGELDDVRAQVVRLDDARHGTPECRGSTYRVAVTCFSMLRATPSSFDVGQES